MTDDRNRRDQPEDEPVVIGAGLQHVEQSLRSELHQEAGRIEPHDRLDAILADAHAAGFSDPGGDPVTSGRHRWLLAVAAAAVAAVVAVGVWVANRPAASPPPAASSSVAASESPSSDATSTTSSETSASSTATTESGGPVTTKTMSVPVYYVGPRSDGSTALVLYREFVSSEVAQPGKAADKATAALQQALSGDPAGAPYRPMWRGVTVDKVSLEAKEIDVTLSQGAEGLDKSEGQIAVQQLVWTAQAAVGEGNLPVRFTLADGSTILAGDLQTDQAYTRPTEVMAVYDLLSSLWIDSPSRGETLPVGKVSVSGIASTFEANVQWKVTELDKAGAGKTVSSGFTTAEVGAPNRGKFSFTTDKPLPAGDYAVTVFETSAKDGTVSTSVTMPFTLK